MDTIVMDTVISHSIVALIGALIGAAVAYWLTRRTGPGRSASKAQAELNEYRERVADHFTRTAALVDQLTDSYKDVFDQLQAGAVDLLDEQTLREKLAHQDAEVITLNRLGYRGSEEPGADDRGGDEDEQEAPDDRK